MEDVATDAPVKRRPRLASRASLTRLNSALRFHTVSEQDHNLWIGGIPDSAALPGDGSLDEVLLRHGEVASLSIHTMPGGGTWCFVTYRRAGDAEQALRSSLAVHDCTLRVRRVDYERVHHNRKLEALWNAHAAVRVTRIPTEHATQAGVRKMFSCFGDITAILVRTKATFGGAMDASWALIVFRQPEHAASAASWPMECRSSLTGHMQKLGTAFFDVEFQKGRPKHCREGGALKDVKRTYSSDTPHEKAREAKEDLVAPEPEASSGHVGASSPVHSGPGSPASATPPRAQLQPQDGGRSFKTTGRSFMSASRVLTATSTLVKMSQAGELRKIKGRRVNASGEVVYNVLRRDGSEVWAAQRQLMAVKWLAAMVDEYEDGIALESFVTTLGQTAVLSDTARLVSTVAAALSGARRAAASAKLRIRQKIARQEKERLAQEEVLRLERARRARQLRNMRRREEGRREVVYSRLAATPGHWVHHHTRDPGMQSVLETSLNDVTPPPVFMNRSADIYSALPCTRDALTYKYTPPRPSGKAHNSSSPMKAKKQAPRGYLEKRVPLRRPRPHSAGPHFSRWSPPTSTSASRRPATPGATRTGASTEDSADLSGVIGAVTPLSDQGHEGGHSASVLSPIRVAGAASTPLKYVASAGFVSASPGGAVTPGKASAGRAADDAR